MGRWQSQEGTYTGRPPEQIETQPLNCQATDSPKPLTERGPGLQKGGCRAQDPSNGAGTENEEPAGAPDSPCPAQRDAGSDVQAGLTGRGRNGKKGPDYAGDCTTVAQRPTWRPLSLLPACSCLGTVCGEPN